MLIGVTNCPWESDQKLLQQVYQKYVMIPKGDYSSRYCLWKYLLGQYAAISWQFDISGMSRISDGYTVGMYYHKIKIDYYEWQHFHDDLFGLGSIINTVKEVITIKRMLQLRVQPLSPLELINALCKYIPVYKEEDEAFELWWTKTPMCKRRIQAVEQRLEEEFEMAAKQASAKRNA